MSRPEGLDDTFRGLLRTLKHLRPYLRDERRIIWGGLAALLAGVVLRLLEPWPLKLVLDRVLVPRTANAWAWLEAIRPEALLALCALAVVGLALVLAAADYWSKVGFALVGNRVLTRVRTDLYRHLQRLSLDFHGTARGGDLTIRVIGDVAMVREVAVTALLPLLANVAVLGAMAGVMIWLDVRLAGLAVLTLPLLLIRTTRLSHRIHAVSREQRQREGALASTAAESVAAIRTVKALSLERRFAQEFDRHAARDLREGVRGKRLSANLERSVDVTVATSRALVLFFGARLVLSGALSLGDLIIFFAYLKRAFRPVRDVAKYAARIAKATAAADRIFSILDRQPEVRDAPGAIEVERVEGCLRFEHVSVLRGGSCALDDVSLDIDARTLVAVVGPSGAGKSTLVQLVLRLFDPTQGRVLLDGRDLRGVTLESLRSQIGTVLQEGVLFSGSVYDNIALGNETADRETIMRAAMLAHATAFVTRLPQGFDTPIGERGARLSGGERQRIAVARALSRDPRILILDEPTTGLDALSGAEVARAIRSAAESRTVLLVTHDMELASLADRVAVLDSGRLVEFGAPEDLRLADGLFARLSQREGKPHARIA